MISNVLRTCSAHGTAEVDWNCFVTLNSIYPVSQTVEFLGFWANGLLIQLYGNFALLHSLLASLRNLIIYLISNASNLGSTPVCLASLSRRVARQTLHHKVYRFQTPAFGQRSCDHQRCNETRIIPYPKHRHTCTPVEVQSMRFERCVKTKTPYLSIVYSITANIASYTQGMWGSNADSRQSTKSAPQIATDQMSPCSRKSLTGNEI